MPIALLPTASATPRQAALARELKDLRLGNGIGSKWLRLFIGLSHPEVAARRDFAFDVEYNRVEITPEIETAWRGAVDAAVRGEIPAALRECPCDLCGASTGSWLHDVCGGCMEAGMRIQLACRRA